MNEKSWCSDEASWETTDSIDGVTAVPFYWTNFWLYGKADLRHNINRLFSAARCASQCKLRRSRANEAVKTWDVSTGIRNRWLRHHADYYQSTLLAEWNSCWCYAEHVCQDWSVRCLYWLNCCITLTIDILIVGRQLWQSREWRNWGQDETRS